MKTGCSGGAGENGQKVTGVVQDVVAMWMTRTRVVAEALNPGYVTKVESQQQDRTDAICERGAMIAQVFFS